jgi:hypothetical protein
VLRHPYYFLDTGIDYMKTYPYFWLICAIALLPLGVSAEENCVPAVDAMDSMNVNQKTCDYSNEGLNGVIQNAFKKDQKKLTENKSAGLKNTTSQKSAVTVQSARNSEQKLTAEVDQWSSVGLVRSQLLPRALAKCASGFNLKDEIYKPLAMGRIELTIIFNCL